MARRADMTMAEIRRADHYRIQRKARLASEAWLLYAHVGPRPRPYQALTGRGGRRQARWLDGSGFPCGFAVLHSPELPFFRAIVGVLPTGHDAGGRGGSVWVDAETWVNRRDVSGPNYFHDRAPRRYLKREMGMVEGLLRASI